PIGIAKTAAELEIVGSGVAGDERSRATGEPLDRPRHASAEEHGFGAVPTQVFDVRVVGKATEQIQRRADDDRSRVGDDLHALRCAVEKPVGFRALIRKTSRDRSVDREHRYGETGEAYGPDYIAAVEQRTPRGIGG